MKKSLLTIIAIGAAAGMMGCAHVHKVDGPQEKTEIPAGIKVGIGGSEVKDGETVRVLKSVCKKVNRNRGGSINQCNFQEVGKATVLKVIDHDSAIVEPIDGVAIDSSMRVEK